MSELVPVTQDSSVRVPATVQLHEDERVVLTLLPSHWWTLGFYVFSLGLWHFWRKRHVYILTDQRVIVTKGIINTTVGSAPLSRIQDIHVRRSILTGGTVAWSTAGGSLGVTKVIHITRANADLFAQAMSPYLGRAPQGA